ncbi:hypothetical protein LINGRAHAP2_LOCUS34051 [Linum grandiflorum]
MMPDKGHVFEKRVSFWILIGKLPPPTFIEKTTPLRISSPTMGILLIFRTKIETTRL